MSSAICLLQSLTIYQLFHAAVAELIDNAVDEIQNGATFVMVDKISDPRDNSPALLIQDDGGGMDPEAIRRCMSFGFSGKMSSKSIGQYGNGFKTSTMRLGADAIVFTRQMGSGRLTQSISLLSYTYLFHTGMDRIVIPMIDYDYMMSTATWKPLYRDGKENFRSNASIILQWSPYSTEAELLKQFDNVGDHGTKIIIYNLWFADDGALELDFNCDLEDICLRGSDSTRRSSKKLTSEEHIGIRYRFSLRNDIITTIGFLKEAPDVNIHGFNIYHKNRLILVKKRTRASLPKPLIDYPRDDGLVGLNNVSRLDPADESDNLVNLSIGSVSQSENQRPDPVNTETRLLTAPDATTTEKNCTKSQVMPFNLIVVPYAQLAIFNIDEQSKQEVVLMMLENKNLQEKCLEYVKSEEKLIQKVSSLKKELEKERKKYAWMLRKLEELGAA
ncbi:Protein MICRORCHIDIA 6 [Bienertia sinuspersici]